MPLPIGKQMCTQPIPYCHIPDTKDAGYTLARYTVGKQEIQCVVEAIGRERIVTHSLHTNAVYLLPRQLIPGGLTAACV